MTDQISWNMLDSSYKILYEKRLQKTLDSLPDDVKKVFNKKLEYFKNNPSHPSLNTKLYSVNQQVLSQLGVDQIYEFYINRKDYRCIFYVIHESKEIIIAFVGNHSQVKNKFS